MASKSRNGLIHELRRRRVFNTVAIYIVGAWVALQVSDLAFPALGVPESAIRYIWTSAFLLFPLVLIFGWRYDITPRGIIRTEPIDGTESIELNLKRADYLVLLGLLGVGLVVLFGSVNRIQQEIQAEPVQQSAAKPEVRENSIAVLPFKNLDINQDTGYFSDGITEEILDRLSGLKALHVLASNSSFQFRDSKESLDKVMEKLGVRYVLQGSIRREEDFVRVTARLIDDVGYQVWSEQFDRKLEGIFAIQTEIASNVANQIIHEIVPLEELPAGRTTNNMEAYNEYLVGKAYLDSRTRGWREKAINAFRRAIEMDPGFAPPYAGLTLAITVNTGPGPQWEEGRELAERALELDPDLAEAHAALALIMMAEAVLDEEQLQLAALSYRRALELNPSLGSAYNGLAIALHRMGKGKEAMDAQYKGLAIDPLNPPLVANIAGMESRAGNFDRAEQLLLRLLSIPNPPSLAYMDLYNVYNSWGRFSDAIAIAKQALYASANPRGIFEVSTLAWGYSNLGMIDDANYWLDQLLEDGQLNLATLDLTFNLLRARDADSELGARLQQLVDDTEFLQEKHHPWTLAQFGLVNIQLGNFHKGSQQLDLGLRLSLAGENQSEPATSISIQALLMQANPPDIAFVLHRLAYAYQQIGQNTKAEEILSSLDEGLLETGFDMKSSALHQALKGNNPAALQALRIMQESGQAVYFGPNKYHEIIHDPVWAATIKTQGFPALLAEMKTEVDRQRAIVEKIEADNNFMEEIKHRPVN